MNNESLPLEQRQAAQEKQLALFRAQRGTQPQASPSLGISPQQAQLDHEAGQIAELGRTMNDSSLPFAQREAARMRQFELLQRAHAYGWSTRAAAPDAPQFRTQPRPQAEDPGAVQENQEREWLRTCYDRAMRGKLMSPEQFRDNDAWIKVLLERKLQREQTGKRLLAPLTGWPGSETQQASEAAGDEGAQQVAAEEAQYQEALRRAMVGRYRTTAEWRDLQYRIQVHHERMEYRRKTGKSFIPDHICQPHPKEEVQSNGPRW
jgi:hypothetical protein